MELSGREAHGVNLPLEYLPHSAANMTTKSFLSKLLAGRTCKYRWMILGLLKKLTAYEKRELLKGLRTEFPVEFTPNAGKQKKIIKIANKALVGDLYFEKYIDYIIWIRNALTVTQ